MKGSALVFLLSLMCFAESYKILIVYPQNVKSLSILGFGFARHLINAGHEVTFITLFPSKSVNTTNLRQIDISENIALQDSEPLSFANIFANTAPTLDYKFLQESGAEISEQILTNEKVQKILQDPKEHFDAVIVDLIEAEAYAGLSVLFDCPMIWANSMGTHWQVMRLITDANNPSYDPDYLGSNIPPLSFSQRVQELWYRIRWSVKKILSTIPEEERIYKEVFGPLLAKRGRKLPNYLDVLYNASLIFGNEHNAIINRPSTPQNYKFIGGFHIEEPIKPLPKDLQQLMDNAKHGVIYFSMGTYWKSKEMPKSLTRALLDMFGQLKETVIWKYEDNIADIPKNVHLVPWAPQPSILAHPNCKFFITHGGLLSAIESIYFGIPTIGIPILFDQHKNVHRSVASGYAIKVDLTLDLPKNLKAAIEVMLKDDSYRARAKELSEIYHDVTTKPGDELVHWVNHVIRTRGAPHLRSPAVHVPLYQRMYLDLIGLILATLFIVAFYVCRIVKKLTNSSEKVKQN